MQTRISLALPIYLTAQTETKEYESKFYTYDLRLRRFFKHENPSIFNFGNFLPVQVERDLYCYRITLRTQLICYSDIRPSAKVYGWTDCNVIEKACPPVRKEGLSLVKFGSSNKPFIFAIGGQTPSN